MAQRKITYIDLFAGAGGLSEGFVRAGYDAIAHIEMDRYACETLKTRAAFHYLKQKGNLDIYKEYLRTKKPKENGEKLWNKVPKNVTDTVLQIAIGADTINGIFKKVDELRKGKDIDIIVGGPPCQAYSIVGRSRMGKDVVNDPRNELYKYYIEFLKKFSPKMFVFENVTGIKTARNGETLRDFKSLVHSAGYEMDLKVQKASDYGVLQNRQRVIIVGWREELNKDNQHNYFYPELKVKKNCFAVLKDLFSDLPVRKAGEGEMTGIVEYTKPLESMPYLENSGIRTKELDFTTQHIARPQNLNDREIYCLAVKEWYKNKKQLDYSKIPERLQTHKNKRSFLDRYSVVNPDGCCHTVVAHLSKDGHYYIYPTPEPTIDNVRSITVREAARLQSFPDDYFFEGSRGAAFRQIGNAVPVVLAYKIAIELKKQLKHGL